eukprot:1216969-Amphidinium_carterae.2
MMCGANGVASDAETQMINLLAKDRFQLWRMEASTTYVGVDWFAMPSVRVTCAGAWPSLGGRRANGETRDGRHIV